MQNPKFEIQSGIDDNYYFNLKNIDGKILLSSNSYNTKKRCEEAIRAVREVSQVEDQFYINQAGTGQYYFELKNISNEIVGKSDIYDNTDDLFEEMDFVTETAREAAIFYSLN